MTSHLTTTDLARMRRGGLRPLRTDHALALLDAAVRDGRPFLAAADLDMAALTAAPAEAVPGILRELAAGSVRRRIATTAQTRPAELAAQLAGLHSAERQRTLLTLVRAQAAAALGHSEIGAVHPETTFNDLGFDSLTAVELRNRLSAATGLHLSPALVFDYPDPSSLVGYLDSRLSPDGSATLTPIAFDSVLDEVARLEGMLAALPGHGLDSRAVQARLEALLGTWKASRNRPHGGSTAGRLEVATADQVIEFIDNELGLSGQG